MYCSYCGYSYIEVECDICHMKTQICGCDCGRRTCEEHFCVECQEPFLELNEDGECKSCEENRLETEQYHANDIIGLG